MRHTGAIPKTEAQMPALEGAGARVSGWAPGVPRAIRRPGARVVVGGWDQGNISGRCWHLAGRSPTRLPAEAGVCRQDRLAVVGVQGRASRGPARPAPARRGPRESPSVRAASGHRYDAARHRAAAGHAGEARVASHVGKSRSPRRRGCRVRLGGGDGLPLAAALTGRPNQPGPPSDSIITNQQINSRRQPSAARRD